MIIFGSKDLQATYHLVIAVHGSRLVQVIETHLAHPEKYPIVYHGPEGRPEKKQDPLVKMTQKEWGKLLHRKVSDQEASTIISVFTHLSALVAEIKKVPHAKS